MAAFRMMFQYTDSQSPLGMRGIFSWYDKTKDIRLDFDMYL